MWKKWPLILGRNTYLPRKASDEISTSARSLCVEMRLGKEHGASQASIAGNRAKCFDVTVLDHLHDNSFNHALIVGHAHQVYMRKSESRSLSYFLPLFDRYII